MQDWMDRIVDKDLLQFNLTFCSLYIAVYEHITENVAESIKCFLCDEAVEDGQLVFKETKDYKEEIKNKVVDSNGNKNITKASFLWLVDNGAITKNEYQVFLDAKKIRNRYAHELFKIICTGLPESDAEHFFAFYNLYLKIVKWFYINIDAPIMGYDIPDDTEDMEVHSLDSVMLKVILDVLYQDKSEEYKNYMKDLDIQNGGSDL